MDDNLNQQKQKRVMPQNDLQFYMLTTDPAWGDTQVPYELLLKLAKKEKILNPETGEIQEKLISRWGELKTFSRDLRLGNLSYLTGELPACSYYLDLANDFLREEFPEAFLILYSRSATIIELSQSKGGFFRKIMHTFRQELSHREEEPPKKSLFGASKKKEYYE